MIGGALSSWGGTCTVSAIRETRAERESMTAPFLQLEGFTRRGQDGAPLPFFSFLNLFLAMLGLHCCEGFSRVEESGDYSRVAVHGLLIVEASFVEHRL